MLLPTLIEFDQWVDKELSIIRESEDEIECPECEGKGYVSEECHCCDQETTKKCGDCNGEGVLIPCEMRLEDIKQTLLTKGRFYNKREEELKMLASYLSLNYDDLAFCYELPNNQWKFKYVNSKKKYVLS